MNFWRGEGAHEATGTWDANCNGDDDRGHSQCNASSEIVYGEW